MKRKFRSGFAAVLAAIGMTSVPEIPAQDGVVIELNGDIQIRAGAVVVKGASKKKTEEDKPKIEFPEKLEKAMKALLEKCVEARRKPAQKEMEAAIEEIAEFHKLDEAAVKKLETLSKKAVESSLVPWAKAADEYLRDELGDEIDEDKVEESVKQILEEIEKAEPAEVVADVPKGKGLDPDQQPEWDAALKEVLTDEQMAAWKENEEEEKAKAEKQFAKLIEITSDNYKRQYGSQMDPIVDDILSTVNLDKERSEKLKAAAESAIGAFVKHWKKKATEHVKGAEESQREAMLKRGYVSIGVDADSLPQKQEAWTGALEKILTKEEKAQWDAALADRESRRERSATQMMLAAVDELMALTAEQRKKLEPLLKGKAIETMTTQLKRDYWGSMNVVRIVQYAKTADQKKVRAILDDDQWRRWQAAVSPKKSTRSAVKAGAKTPKPPPGPDPVAVEKAITSHLYRMMVREREKILSDILVQAEDAGRVLSLSPEVCDQLQTAAKGSAEEAIDTWSGNMDGWVRRSVKGATPGNIDQRLRNLGSVRFGRSKKATDSPIWKAVVSTYLSDEQQAIWQKEIEQRHACQQRATASLIVTQLDNAARLTSKQVGEIEPLIATAIDEYGPDINRYFSSWSNDTPWYLNSYYNMIPFQGIPEKQAKEILSKAQWKIWEERFHNRVSHYWDQVLQYHEERMKEEKKAKQTKVKETEKEEPAGDKVVKES